MESIVYIDKQREDAVVSSNPPRFRLEQPASLTLTPGALTHQIA